jgi:hypothetical protein
MTAVCKLVQFSEVNGMAMCLASWRTMMFTHHEISCGLLIFKL